MILDFTASWCPPCKRIGPIYAAMADEPGYKDILFKKIDADEVREVAQFYEIKAYPTFVMFKYGSEVSRTEGADEEKIRAMIEQNLGD